MRGKQYGKTVLCLRNVLHLLGLNRTGNCDIEKRSYIMFMNVTKVIAIVYMVLGCVRLQCATGDELHWASYIYRNMRYKNIGKEILMV